MHVDKYKYIMLQGERQQVFEKTIIEEFDVIAIGKMKEWKEKENRDYV